MYLPKYRTVNGKTQAVIQKVLKNEEKIRYNGINCTIFATLLNHNLNSVIYRIQLTRVLNNNTIRTLLLKQMHCYFLTNYNECFKNNNRN